MPALTTLKDMNHDQLLAEGDGEALRFNNIERRGYLIGRFFPIGARRVAPHARAHPARSHR